MPQKKTIKLENEMPNPDTLDLNLRKAAQQGRLGPFAHHLEQQRAVGEVIGGGSHRSADEAKQPIGVWDKPNE